MRGRFTYPAALVAQIGDLACASSPAVVAIDGRSGSGKTSVAAFLAGRLNAVVVVAGDDFYRDQSDDVRRRLSPAAGVQGWFDWQRLRAQALEPLRRREAATYRPYDWAAGGGLALREHRLEPRDVVLLEGVYSARPELADLVDLALLVYTPAEQRRQRLVERDHGGPHLQWHDAWEAAEEHYFGTVRPAAGFAVVISGVSPCRVPTSSTPQGAHRATSSPRPRGSASDR